jgi:hypothetical protein
MLPRKLISVYMDTSKGGKARPLSPSQVIRLNQEKEIYQILIQQNEIILPAQII